MKKKKMRRIISQVRRKFVDGPSVLRVLTAIWTGDANRKGFNPGWAGEHLGRRRCVSMLETAIGVAEDRVAAGIVRRANRAKA